MSKVWMRKSLPQLIIVVLAIWMIAEYFIAVKWIENVGSILRTFQTSVGAFALGLGVVATVYQHGGHVWRRTPGRWFYSGVLLTTMTVMAVSGLIGWLDQPIFAYLWNNVYIPSQQTVYSLLMFYITYASWRALRISSIPSTVFMICAIIVMMMNAPLLQYYIPISTPLANWLFNIPNVGSSRGMALATIGGTIAVYLRTLLGRELGMIGITAGEE